MNQQLHCPYRQATLLQQALTPDKMRISFLLGAGCPVSIRIPFGDSSKPLIPDIQGLTNLVKTELNESTQYKDNFAIIMGQMLDGTKDPTIEEILSYIRSLHEIVKAAPLLGLNKIALSNLDAAICEITTKIVKVSLPNGNTPYHQFASWIEGVQRKHPIEVFTPNYDLLLEQAFEEHKIPYFDGFVGSRDAFFDLASIEDDNLPTRWCRLWKVHGSVNWWRMQNKSNKELYDVVRREISSDTDAQQMIYPSHLKYDQSRRMPYLAMLDRLRAFLSRGQAVLVTCGYSFADQHLNEVILNGLKSNSSAICFGLLYGSRANYSEALERANKHHNLNLLARHGAVLGTVDRDWIKEKNKENPLYGLAITKKEEDEESNCEFHLGDFKIFGEFLALQLSGYSNERIYSDVK